MGGELAHILQPPQTCADGFWRAASNGVSRHFVTKQARHQYRTHPLVVIRSVRGRRACGLKHRVSCLRQPHPVQTCCRTGVIQLWVLQLVRFIKVDVREANVQEERQCFVDSELLRPHPQFSPLVMIGQRGVVRHE